MEHDLTERDRLSAVAALASDLELLGILGDPTRGPAARFYRPPQSDPRALDGPPGARWSRVRAAAAAVIARVRLIGGTSTRSLPARTRAAVPTR